MSLNIKWVYSDPHYWHDNIIKHCSRPFSDVEEMNAELANRYRKHVMPGDTCVWLGDCFFAGKDEEFAALLCSLPGNKILVRGNHDKSNKRMLNCGFDLVTNRLYTKYKGVDLCLNHFPIKEQSKFKEDPRHGQYKNDAPELKDKEYCVHGHIHQPPVYENRCVNVACDNWDFYPVHLDIVLGLIKFYDQY